jgi:hypothetical protein
MEAYKLAGYKKSSAKANATRLMENDGIFHFVRSPVYPWKSEYHEPLSGSDVFEKTAWQMHAHDSGCCRQ